MNVYLLCARFCANNVGRMHCLMWASPYPHFIVKRAEGREVVCLAKGCRTPRCRSKFRKPGFILKPLRRLFLYHYFTDEDTKALRGKKNSSGPYNEGPEIPRRCLGCTKWVRGSPWRFWSSSPSFTHSRSTC